jgi:hypothetical protein
MIAGLAVLPMAAEAAMPLPVFLSRADALQKKGMLALLSGDMKALKDEVQASLGAVRAERLAAKAAGKPQAFCPPVEGGRLTIDELLGGLRQIPAAERARIDVREGLKRVLVRKYPCR